MSTKLEPNMEVVIACDPNAIPADQRAQWVATGMQVYAAALEVQDLPDGFGIRLPSESAMLIKVAEYISNERLCCPFVHFTVEVEPNGGSFWLRLTGGEGVKEYMGSILRENSLLPRLLQRRLASDKTLSES